MSTSLRNELKLYGRLFHHAGSYRLHLGLLLLLSLLATPLVLLTPLPLKIAVDSLTGAQAVPRFLRALLPTSTTDSQAAELTLAVVLLLAIALLDQLQRLASTVLGAYAGERLLLDFRARIFRHVQRLSFSYYDTHGTADSIFRINWDAAAIQWIAIYGFPPLVSAAGLLVGMIVIVALIDWQLTLVALTVAPLILLLTTLARRWLRRGWQRTKDLESAAYGTVQEVLTGLRVVKAFGQEDREQERFVARSDEAARSRVRMTFAEGALGLLVGMVLAAGTALVLFLGGQHFRSGVLSLGDLVLIMGYLALLYTPLQTISRSVTTLQSSLVSAERSLALLDEPTDVPERLGARPLTRAEGSVVFRGVSFAYDDGEPVLRDVSFEVPPGTCVGLAGATGAGKTTLISLLSRFYDPTAGQVLLDDTDLRDYRLADLRGQFSIVLQDTVLFSATIAENIAYGRSSATRAEIIAAAKAANAHPFILSLPDGYETRVGERGMRLSGGERQRIALARAFLKDAPILILDEPTSSVDIHTEAVIMQAMERLMQGRTAFMIAHRLTTLANCDLLLEVSAGRVARVTSVARPSSVEGTDRELSPHACARGNSARGRAEDRQHVQDV
ncbi:MAG TPA: ABC transporter ATP-binding protein [Gemmataceae bacterium]|jgi:ATP-binding cassette subfamily B protein